MSRRTEKIPESVVTSLSSCCVLLCASESRQVGDSSAECGSLLCDSVLKQRLATQCLHHNSANQGVEEGEEE